MRTEEHTAPGQSHAEASPYVGQDLIHGDGFSWSAEKENIVKGPYDYLESHPGKDVRSQLINAFNARSDRESAFSRPLGNPRLLAAVGFSLALQVLVVHLPFLNVAFGTVPLSAGEWLLCLALASSVLWASELRKLLRR